MDSSELFKQFEKAVVNVSEDKLNKTISEGALKLTKSQIETVSFVFWLIYLAETDLNYLLRESRKMSFKIAISEEAKVLADQMLEDKIFGKSHFPDPIEKVIENLPQDTQEKIVGTIKEQYKKKSKIDFDNLEYFIDKIRVLEAFYDNSERVKLLWILNGLRNDISHNRIDELKYKDKDLKDRSTKEMLLLDYFRSSNSIDLKNSSFWNNLTDDEKSEIASNYKNIS